MKAKKKNNATELSNSVWENKHANMMMKNK